MKKNFFKFENLALYTYLVLSLIIITLFIWLFSFLKTNAYNTITTSEIILDPSSIRIVDVNLDRFDKVLKNINNKASSQRVSPKSVFE